MRLGLIILLAAWGLLEADPATANSRSRWCWRYVEFERISPERRARALQSLREIAELRRANPYHGPKPQYEVNPKHTDRRNPRASSLPSDAAELYRYAVPSVGGDGRVTWWSIDQRGVIHRFQGTPNGRVHWNGSTAYEGSVEGIRRRDIPQHIQRRLELQHEYDRLLLRNGASAEPW
jgi:hypothetical protein